MLTTPASRDPRAAGERAQGAPRRLHALDTPGTSEKVPPVSGAWTSRALPSYQSARDALLWPRRARLGARRPGGVGLRPRGALPRALAARVPGRLPRHARRRRRRGHRAGAFLAAIRSLDRFDRRRPFGPWLHRIVVNRAIDWARARRLRGGDRARGRRGRSPADGDPDGLAAAIARLPRAAGGDRPPSPARVHARRDRRPARPAARDGQLAAAPRVSTRWGRNCEARARADRDPRRARGARARLAVVRARRSPSGSRTPVAARFVRPFAAAALAVVAAARSALPGERVIDDVRRGDRGRVGRRGALPPPRRRSPARDLGVRRLGRRRGRLERRLGDYDDAAWSPFGRYVVASTRGRARRARAGRRRSLEALAAGRPLPPAGAGTRTDTRIAYVSRRHAPRRRRRRQGRRDVVAGRSRPQPRACSRWAPGQRFELSLPGDHRPRRRHARPRRQALAAPLAGPSHRGSSTGRRTADRLARSRTRPSTCSPRGSRHGRTHPERPAFAAWPTARSHATRARTRSGTAARARRRARAGLGQARFQPRLVARRPLAPGRRPTSPAVAVRTASRPRHGSRGRDRGAVRLDKPAADRGPGAAREPDGEFVVGAAALALAPDAAARRLGGTPTALVDRRPRVARGRVRRVGRQGARRIRTPPALPRSRRSGTMPSAQRARPAVDHRRSPLRVREVIDSFTSRATPLRPASTPSSTDSAQRSSSPSTCRAPRGRPGTRRRSAAPVPSRPRRLGRASATRPTGSPRSTSPTRPDPEVMRRIAPPFLAHDVGLARPRVGDRWCVTGTRPLRRGRALRSFRPTLRPSTSRS